MNSNYQKGRRFEYAVMKQLRQKGWIAMRTAGSHGPYDIIAFLPHTNPVHTNCVTQRRTDYLTYTTVFSGIGIQCKVKTRRTSTIRIL